MSHTEQSRFKRGTEARAGEQTGFSLVELLIVITIMAILAALAYPSLSQYLLKNRRVAAQQSLYGLQLKQEEWRISHPQYAQQLSELDPRLAAHAHYNFSVNQASNSQYELTATAKSGSSQVRDYQGHQSCKTLTLNRAHEKTPAECWE